MMEVVEGAEVLKEVEVEMLWEGGTLWLPDPDAEEDADDVEDRFLKLNMSRK